METQRKIPFSYIYVGLLAALAFQAWLQREPELTLDYSDFKALLRAGEVRDVRVSPQLISGKLDLTNSTVELPESVRKAIPPGDQAKPIAFLTPRVAGDEALVQELDAAKIRYSGASDGGWLATLISWVGPALIFALVWIYMMRKMGGRGGDLVGIGKSKAKVFVQKNIGVKFSDVEGIDEAEADLIEVVEFLRQPDQYTRLGGHIPKGILIVGAPGTGKTLLAKALAGEANVPFLSISGSEFVEMFVGVGAARVRDLFKQAESLAPCIIFIDEIDALGRARGVAGFAGHEEREQTLNQLLVEMDGFDTKRGVIILAATNRPEILDPALLRPGRFDRHVAIDRPDIRGRERILKLHAARVVLGADVDLSAVAAKTAGLVGADLANIVNEAALHAARDKKSAVTMSDFEAAIDRALAGVEKKSRVMNVKEKETVAYHEAGHALIAEFRATTDKVAKVSIIPRGIGALGFTQQLPTEDRYLMKHSELLDRLDVLLGGRLAEQVAFGEVSTGAQDDLQRATDLVRHMLTRYGMSKALGAAVLEVGRGGTYLDESGAPAREFSEATAQKIDAEIQNVLTEAEARVQATLTSRRAELEALAQLLLRKETVDREALLAVLKEHQREPLSVVPTSRPSVAG